MKVRRIDFYPDDWLVGSVVLKDDERGVYITICMLIYSRGGPVSECHVRSLSSSHGNAFNRILCRLETLGKIIRNGSEITQKRCENELERSRKRIGIKRENLSKVSKNNDVPPPTVYNNHQSSIINQQSSIKKSPQQRGMRLPADFEVPEDWKEEARRMRSTGGLPAINLDLEAGHFVDYWHSKAGKDGCKLDWRATWRNWCRNSRSKTINGIEPDLSFYRGPSGPPPQIDPNTGKILLAKPH